MNVQPLGRLFGTVEYYKPEDIKNIIEGMTVEQSIYLLSESMEYANRNGLFSLVESEIVSKSLRMISNNLSTLNEEKPQ